MPTTLPRTVAGRIEYYRQRIAAWAADPAAIGLSPETVAGVSAAIDRAEAAYVQAQRSRQQAQNDTAVQRDALRDLNTIGSGAIATIRAFADLADTPLAVFDRADMTPPATGGPPLPAPAAAKNLRATLLTSGAVRLKWDGTTANGTYYDVYRQLGTERGLTLIGSCPARVFDDTTIPAGTATALYACTARRGTLFADLSTPALVRFGVVGHAAARLAA